MFTPQRKGWSTGWSLSPKVAADGQENGSVLGKSKGKGVAGGEAPSPAQASPGENGGGVVGGSGEMEVWRSFREAGFLDNSSLQRRDREALVTRISEVEKELHEYQYNMGLLLIEKKEWFSKYEEMRQGLAEAEEILKREQTSHLIAVSELEKREEKMRNAFGVEKQCVADLEKALREMRAEIAEVKFTSDKKLADAHAMEASIEEKYLEVEGKLHSADAKLAEASRKTSEIDRKLEDVEDRERKLQRDFLSLNTERKTHEKDLAEQREHLQNWEKKLQEGQKRLGDGHRLLNEREDRENETQVILKKKEEELEEARRVIEVRKNSLKDKEDDISTRLRALAVKEKDADIKKENLAKREKDLLAIEEQLNARERVEIQKLLDDHNAILAAKKQEFELETEQKRKSVDKECKNKLESVEKEKIVLERKEEQLSKREQALESKMEKLKIKEKDLDAKSKALKKWEESIKDDEKKLQVEKQQLGKDMQELMISKAGLESLKSTIEAEKQRTAKETENLKLTIEEREHHVLLQLKLKEEIEECGKLKESLLRKTESLRQEREKFEKEWEELDEKRIALEAEQKQADDEKSRFQKWQHNEEERLKKEELEARVNIQRELENLRLKKEAFESAMEHERSEARELVKRERADIARELELRKHELEMNMQKKQEDMENRLQERESEFDRRREDELSRIKSLNNSNESNIRKVRMDQDRVEREKEELSIYTKKLEADQLEVRKDIDTLRMLSKNLKDQREEFNQEREHFLALAEQCKICKNCGVSISELDLLGLQPLKEIGDAGNVLLPSLADGYLGESVVRRKTELSPPEAGSPSFSSGGRMTWLKKCSRLFILSPGKKVGPSTEAQAEKPISFGAQLDRFASEGETNYESVPSYGIVDDSMDTQRAQNDSGAKENEGSERLDKSGEEPEPSIGITDNSVDIIIGGRDGEPIITSINDSQPQPSKPRQYQSRRRGRPKTIKRTRSVKAVVEDAKAILGEASGDEKNGHQNGDAKDSQSIHDESQGDSVNATRARHKRRHPHTDGVATSELDADDSEARSESVSLGGRRKRRQISAPGMQTPGEKRYNLRRSTTAGTVAAAQAMANQTKGLKSGSHQQPPENEAFKDGGDGGGTSSKHELTVVPSHGFVGEIKEATHVPEKTNLGSAMEVKEISSQKLVRFGTEETHVDCDEDIVVKSLEFSEQSGEDGDEVDGLAATPSGGVSGSGGEDDEDEEDSEKHNASIGKKLWTFFTT